MAVRLVLLGHVPRLYVNPMSFGHAPMIRVIKTIKTPLYRGTVQLWKLFQQPEERSSRSFASQVMRLLPAVAIYCRKYWLLGRAISPIIVYASYICLWNNLRVKFFRRRTKTVETVCFVGYEISYRRQPSK